MVAFFNQVKKKYIYIYNPKYIIVLYDCSDGTYAALYLQSPLSGLLIGLCISKRVSFRI